MIKKKLFILILSVLVFIGIIIFYYPKKENVPICGNGICEIYENSVNCCMDCGCYGNTEVCINNRCEIKKIQISDEEFLKIIRKYFQLRNEKILNIDEISTISLKNILAKTTIVTTEKDSYGVTVAENKTLFLYECCHPGGELIDVWTGS